MKRWLWNWGPAVLQMAAIFVFSSLSVVELPGGISGRTGHFGGYAVLGALVLRALAAARWSGVVWRTGWQAWGVSAAYGASDEVHQAFVPGRTPAIDDWVTDVLGAGAGVLVTLGVAIAARGQRREV